MGFTASKQYGISNRLLVEQANYLCFWHFIVGVFLSLHKYSIVEILQNLDKAREENKKHPNPTIRDKYGIIFYAYICFKIL